MWVPMNNTGHFTFIICSYIFTIPCHFYLVYSSEHLSSLHTNYSTLDYSASQQNDAEVSKQLNQRPLLEKF